MGSGQRGDATNLVGPPAVCEKTGLQAPHRVRDQVQGRGGENGVGFDKPLDLPRAVFDGVAGMNRNGESLASTLPQKGNHISEVLETNGTDPSSLEAEQPVQKQDGVTASGQGSIRFAPDKLRGAFDNQFEVEGFLKVEISPFVVREHLVHASALPGDNDHGDFLGCRVGGEGVQRLKAILFGHDQVHDDEVGTAFSSQVQALAPVDRGENLEVVALQVPAEHFPGLLRVIHDKNGSGLGNPHHRMAPFPDLKSRRVSSRVDPPIVKSGWRAVNAAVDPGHAGSRGKMKTSPE